MWMMAGSTGCPRWAIEGLWAVARERADTAQLQKLAGILAQADSKSTIFRNNYAFYSLLIHSEDGNPHREAEKLFTEHPGDTSVAVTRALSLHLQGKPVEAAAITGSLPPAELAKPQVALYHGIFLTAAGDTAKAAEFLAVTQGWKILSEEKALLERAKQSVSKAAGVRELAKAATVAKLARTAREAEGDKAVEIARAARAARAAQITEDAAQPPNAAR
jgi:hypothetical protein